MRYSPRLTAEVVLANRPMRRALLSLNGLSPPWERDPLPVPRGTRSSAWVDGMIRRLGFLQVDAVSAVERAQHQILFSRNPQYRQSWLTTRLEKARTVFENWTHDAAILPSDVMPYWRHFCDRFSRYEIHPGYRRYFESIDGDDVAQVLRRIEEQGPLKPRDLASDKAGRNWPGADGDAAGFALPSVAKVAMEYLWRSGRLAVTRRDKREKVYDLIERVLPAEHLEPRVSLSDYVDWACRQALHRLGAATPAQIARFFHAVHTAEAANWCERGLGKDLVASRVELADGSRTTAAIYTLEEDVDRLREPPGCGRRLRLLSPFDPLIHDRQRTERVFGFDYTVEIFVPAKKRKYGYFVLPILEGDRFTGRVDVKVDRGARVLRALALYWEPGVRETPNRRRALERQLGRLARFCGADEVELA